MSNNTGSTSPLILPKLDLSAVTVSYCNDVRSSNLNTTTLASVIEAIRANEDLASKISAVRAISDDSERRKKKQETLPYFNLGLFRENKRKNEQLLSTEFMVFDYDHVVSLPDLRAQLIQDPTLFLLFTSPSGDGLKAVYRLDRSITDYNEFNAIYRHYSARFAEEFRIKLDDSTKDAARATFFSHDRDLYLNVDAELLATNGITAATAKVNMKSVGQSLDDLSFLPSAIEHLRTRLKGYDHWFQCGMALASLGEAGRAHFHTLSRNPRYKDTPAEIDAKFSDFVKNRKGAYTIASLFQIAKEYGYVYPKLTQALPAPPVPASDFAAELEQQFQKDDVRDPNKLLGFGLSKFKELAGHIDGIQPAFYHLAAETNIGKTAVLTNLTLDVLDTNPDVTVVFFSLDDSRLYTSYRLLSIMTQCEINNVKRPLVDPYMKPKLDAARAKLVDLVRSDRLQIRDISEVQHIDQVKEIIKTVPDLSKLVVFIDGLYNLSVNNGTGGIREENIERAQKIKQIVDTYRIPILSTGELRKKAAQDKMDKKPTVHDLMETGKFAYNANVVMLLYADDPAMLSSDRPALTLEFAKNKLSDFKGTQVLRFTRNTGTMEETQSMFQAMQPPINYSPATPGADELF